MSISNEEKDSICPICREELKSSPTYTLPNCQHKFHTNCIITWFRSGHSSCPNCRDSPPRLSHSYSGTRRYMNLYSINGPAGNSGEEYINGNLGADTGLPD
jgi:predicted amidophosphoribosyltransferase